MKEREQKKMTVAERFAQIILTEAVCIALLVLTAMAIRYLFAGQGADVVAWYRQHFCVDTDVNEVLSSGADHAV